MRFFQITAELRLDEWFHGAAAVANDSAPAWEELTIRSVLAGAGENGSDAVAEESGFAYLAEDPEVFIHDADGNLLQDGRWTYTWDAENRLVRMETLSTAVTAGAPKQRLIFSYDSQNRRFRKTVLEDSGNGWQVADKRLYLYDNWNLIAELVMGQNGLEVIRSYIWGLGLSESLQGAGGVGGLLAVEDYTYMETYYPLFDGNGNVLAYRDAVTGDYVAVYEYGAFGETLQMIGSNVEELNFRFSTKYTDNETNLVYYGFRYYDANTGRWLNRDPIEELGAYMLRGGDSQDLQWIVSGLNEDLYVFNGNNPIDRYDVLGLNWFNCFSDCIEYNSAERLGMYVATLGASGASVPKTWLAAVYEAVGNQKAAHAIRVQLKMFPQSRWTTFPSSLATYIRTPGIISNAAVARVAGTLGGALRAAGRASSIALVGFGTYYIGIEVKCCAGCLADPRFDPESMDYAQEIADFYF